MCFIICEFLETLRIKFERVNNIKKRNRRQNGNCSRSHNNFGGNTICFAATISKLGCAKIIKLCLLRTNSNKKFQLAAHVITTIDQFMRTQSVCFHLQDFIHSFLDQIVFWRWHLIFRFRMHA